MQQMLRVCKDATALIYISKGIPISYLHSLMHEQNDVTWRKERQVNHSSMVY